MRCKRLHSESPTGWDFECVPWKGMQNAVFGRVPASEGVTHGVLQKLTKFSLGCVSKSVEKCWRRGVILLIAYQNPTLAPIFFCNPICAHPISRTPLKSRSASKRRRRGPATTPGDRLQHAQLESTRDWEGCRALQLRLLPFISSGLDPSLPLRHSPLILRSCCRRCARPAGPRPSFDTAAESRSPHPNSARSVLPLAASSRQNRHCPRALD
jgi:hypothetical protein